MLTGINIDAGIAMTLRLALALLFAHAVYHKLRAPSAFVATLRDYRLLPPELSVVVASLLIVAELCTAVGLIASPRAGSYAALALLMSYTGAIGVNLLRGRRDIDCGCSGPAVRQTLSGWLVWRNLTLAGIAALALAPESSRPLSVLDAFTTAAALVALALLYVAANTLSATFSTVRALILFTWNVNTMSTALLASNITLWVLVIVLALVVVALARQIGVLHERIAPAGALMVAGGPKVGEAAPVIEVSDLRGNDITIGAVRDDDKSTLVFFLSPTCPVCKTLLPVLKSAQRSEKDWLHILLASDGELAKQQAFVEDAQLQSFAYVVSSNLGLSYQVGKLPFAVLIDSAGILRSKGLVNSREHLESLFEARQLGVASVQEYLQRGA